MPKTPPAAGGGYLSLKVRYPGLSSISRLCRPEPRAPQKARGEPLNQRNHYTFRIGQKKVANHTLKSYTFGIKACASPLRGGEVRSWDRFGVSV